MLLRAWPGKMCLAGRLRRSTVAAPKTPVWRSASPVRTPSVGLGSPFYQPLLLFALGLPAPVLRSVGRRGGRWRRGRLRWRWVHWGSDAGERQDDAPGSERVGEGAGASTAAGAAGVGLLCTKDFKFSPGVASVCAEVGRFVAPPDLSALFSRMPVDQMFRSIEANAMRVSAEPRPADVVLRHWRY